MKNLSYTKLEMQNYLKDKNIYPETAKLIFTLRTSMSALKWTSKHDLICPVELCAKEDSQEHLLDHVENGSTVQYSKLFSEYSEENLMVANVLKQGLASRSLLPTR